MEYAALTLMLGMFLVSLLYYAIDTFSREDKKIITVKLFNGCILLAIIHLNLTRVGLMLVIILLVVGVIDPLSEKAIKNGNKK